MGRARGRGCFAKTPPRASVPLLSFCLYLLAAVVRLRVTWGYGRAVSSALSCGHYTSVSCMRPFVIAAAFARRLLAVGFACVRLSAYPSACFRVRSRAFAMTVGRMQLTYVPLPRSTCAAQRFYLPHDNPRRVSTTCPHLHPPSIAGRLNNREKKRFSTLEFAHLINEASKTLASKAAHPSIAGGLNNREKKTVLFSTIGKKKNT